MKRNCLGILLAVFVFATSALVASATTNGLGRTGTAAAVHLDATPNSSLQSGTRTTTLFLMAAFQAPDHTAQHERQDEKDTGRSKDKGKDKFHGAEMSSTAIVLAGVFAVSVYFLFVRRKAQKHI